MLLSFDGISPVLPADAWVAPTAQVVGRVTLEQEASIWFGTVVRGDVEPIHIGSRSNVQDNCVVHTDAGHPARIGAGVVVGHGAVIHGCTIGDGALIGIGATVLTGATVGAGAVVAAGALVTEGAQIPPGMLAVGVPAKVVRPVRPEERRRIDEGAAHYVALARQYRAANLG